MAISEIQTKAGKKKYKVSIWRKGKRHATQTFQRKIDAEKWESKQKSLIDEEEFFPDRPKNITFGEAFDDWFENHAIRNKAPASIVKDKQVFKTYLSPTFKKVVLKNLRTNQFDKFISELSAKTDLSNNSINKILESLRAVLNFAVSRRYILYNPMASIKMLRIDEQPFQYWNFEDGSKFLSFTNGKYQEKDRWKYLLYLLLLKTGIRLGEARALSFENILFKNNIIRICATFDKATNKIKMSTKSRKIRYVPMDKELKRELLRIKSIENSPLVFSSNGKSTYCMDNFRSRTYKKDIEETGVKRIRLHDFRHTYASHYVMNNGNIHDLQMILGHSDIKVTMRYAHLSPGHIASKADIVSFDTNRYQLQEKVIPIGEKSNFIFSHNPETTSGFCNDELKMM